MRQLLLFNHPHYSALNIAAGEHYWRHEVVRAGRSVGALAGVVQGERFISGFSAPFGGIEISRERESPVVIHGAIDEITARLAHTGCRRWVIRAKPMAYSHNEAAIHHAMNRAGWRPSRTDLSFYVDLRLFTRSGTYVDALRSDARRHLRRALALDMRLRLAGSAAAEREAYNLLADNRRAAGRVLKLPFEYLAQLSEHFPGRLRYYLLSEPNETLAVALVYRVEQRCHLVVYWGHRPGSESKAPMNALAYLLIDRLTKEGAAVLDLGTASEDGVPIEGLGAFKRSVLGEPTLRIDYERDA